MTPTSPRPRAAAARTRRAARLAALAIGASTLVSATIAGAEPAPAPPAESSATSTATVAGKGSMDADQITLGGPSGQEVPTPGTARSRDAADGGGGPVAAGWTTTVELLDGTQMVALSWDGDHSGPDGPASARLALRSHGPDGTWGPWLPIAPDPADQGGEGTGRVGSEVLWLGADGADAVEVRVDAGPVAGLEILRMRYHEGEPVAAPERQTATSARAATARPTIRPRSDWATGGWRSTNSGCGSGPTVASRLDFAVVHHTASTNTYTQAQVPGLIDAIYRYHTASLGWCDIAYNFVVDKYGGIWQGRSGDVTKPVVGGHAMGFNTNSVGVTLLGQFEPGASPAAAAPTTAMLDSAARLLAWKLSLHGLDPRGTVTVTSGGSTKYSAGTRVTLPVISYHQQSSTTACPGANVIAKMGALRDLVAAYTGSTPTPEEPVEPTDPDPSRWAPFPDVQTLVYRQYVDFLRNPGTYDARSWWHTNLSNGANHRNQLITSLLSSDELQARSASSVRLYFAYFDRAPDHSGLRFWWQWIDDGKGIRTESAAFARSPEFVQRYGNLADADYVRLVYRNVLGREPDPEGFAFWVDRLRTKRESRGGMMVLFSESGEYKGKTQARTEVVIVHDVMLNRAISTANLREWEPRVRAERTALINQLFASAEYAARF